MAEQKKKLPLLPGYANNHPQPVCGAERRAKKHTLVYYKNSMYDFPCPEHQDPYDEAQAKALVECTQKPDWRFTQEMKDREHIKLSDEAARQIRREEAIPSQAPAWIKHDKQVCRFFAYTQESVTESNTENSRIRYCTIFYYLEDGTTQLTEKKSENSGMPQGALVCRHCIRKKDDSIIGLDDLKCGTNIEIYNRVYRIVGCDAFTRWYYAQNGIDVGEEEDVPLDAWETQKITAQEHAERSAPREVVEGQIYNEKSIGGNRGTNNKLEQFLKNDLRVLRFYCYWDDLTLYGVRQYYVLSFFLASNHIQIADVHQRNSGRDPYPVFYKKNVLKKAPTLGITPGMLEPDAEIYMPKDLICGENISVYGRKLQIYDCDPFTREFYRRWLNIEQACIKIPDPPEHKVDFPIPPHVGVGTEEDTLGSCFALWPKPPKQDLMKLMTKSGMILRFEAEIAEPVYPEDADRKFIVAYYLADDTIAIYEMKRRNSGFMEGKFTEKSKKKNHETGKWYTIDDLYVGKILTVCSVGFRLLRPDEYSLAYMENNPKDFPNCDIDRIRARLTAALGGKSMDGVVMSPDEIQALGILTDQEIITILRKYGNADDMNIQMGEVVGA